MARIDLATAGGKNILAFLDMIGKSEGTTDDPKTQDDGYDTIVGGNVFTDYSDHPRVFVDLPNLGIKSSAAGRYQILAHIFDTYKVQLNLPDFSPVSQDKIAIQLMRECHAIVPLQNDDINTALTSCSSRWASLPAATYGQRTNSVASLVDIYIAAGGSVS